MTSEENTSENKSLEEMLKHIGDDMISVRDSVRQIAEKAEHIAEQTEKVYEMMAIAKDVPLYDPDNDFSFLE